jgi:hypothetical protein
LLSIEADDRILPTNQFDIWLTQTPSARWQSLVSQWLITSRMSGLVGKEESKNVAPLGPELDRVAAAPIRKLTLRLLQESEGSAPKIESLLLLAQWNTPARRSGGIPSDYISWNLREAEWLGITGQGAISKYGIGLLAGADLDEIDEDLPKSVDHILIQSDHTAIAPGPLEHEIAQELAILAEIESRGGATVYRFSEATIRRGLDHGRTGDEIKAFLNTASYELEIPQHLLDVKILP